jgi:hypothetical protein
VPVRPRRGSPFGGYPSWGVSVAVGPILVPIWFFVGPGRWSWSHGWSGWGVSDVVGPVLVPISFFVGPRWWTRSGDRIWSGCGLVSVCSFVGGGGWE